MSDAAKPDAKYRPYRGAMWALYIAFASFIGLCVTISVIRSVQAMSPSRPPRGGTALDPEACRALAQQLFAELDGRRQKLASAETVRLVDADWTRWRVGWMNEFRDAEARCDVDAPERKQTREIFSALEKVADHYTIHAVQFAGEVGPAVDALRAALKPNQPAVTQGSGVPGSTTP